MRKATKKPSLGALVGIRELCKVGSTGKPAIIKLGMPRKTTDKEWACPFQISGLRGQRIRHAYGIDAIQALLMAIEGIRVTLEESGEQFSWAGGEPGTGLTRLIPVAFGLNFAKHLERLVDRDLELFARAAQEGSRRG